MKVKVYKVRVYSIMTDQWVLSRRMATLEGAKNMKGEVIEGTGTDIDESQLDLGEQWTPVDFKP